LGCCLSFAQQEKLNNLGLCQGNEVVVGQFFLRHRNSAFEVSG
jgi:hypothetical protein